MTGFFYRSISKPKFFQDMCVKKTDPIKTKSLKFDAKTN